MGASTGRLHPAKKYAQAHLPANVRANPLPLAPGWPSPQQEHPSLRSPRHQTLGGPAGAGRWRGTWPGSSTLLEFLLWLLALPASSPSPHGLSSGILEHQDKETSLGGPPGLLCSWRPAEKSPLFCGWLTARPADPLPAQGHSANLLAGALSAHPVPLLTCTGPCIRVLERVPGPGAGGVAIPERAMRQLIAGE